MEYYWLLSWEHSVRLSTPHSVSFIDQCYAGVYLLSSSLYVRDSQVTTGLID